MKIGLLTGGGDAPGLNGIIESCCRGLHQNGVTVVGIHDGFEGIFENRHQVLTPEMVAGIHAEAGTLLGTSNRTRIEGRDKEFAANWERLGLDGLIAIGGDGTFAGLRQLASGLKMIGVPKTIDNDLAGTEITFGFDTACSVIAEAVEALAHSARAHRRVMVVETMGRTAGWIALGGGLAGYADAILIPERPFDESRLRDFIRAQQKNKRGLVVVVAEGVFDENAGAHLAKWIERECEWEARHVVPGHLQRARSPTTTDRFLTLTMGIEASRMVLEGAWNQGVVYRSGRVGRAPISDFFAPARRVPADHRWVQLAENIGIFI